MSESGGWGGIGGTGAGAIAWLTCFPVGTGFAPPASLPLGPQPTNAVWGYMMKLSFFYLSAYEHSYRGRPKLSFLFSEDELVLKVRRLRGGSLHPGLNPGLETRSFRAKEPPKPGVYTTSGYKKS